ncbi:glycosyltransferase [Sphingobacterium multivorum]|uniref:glycosyltransferase n=1 Tax=Sphingobacterium multivorum TaxID=28454 RepID=UPI002FDAF7C3
MNKILIITGILPVPTIEHKKTENDILFVAEDEIVSRYANCSFRYFFVFPFANIILAKLSTKWNSYYELGKKDFFNLRGRNLLLLPVILLPKRLFFRDWLINVSLYINRKKIDKVIREYQPTVLHAQNSDSDAYIAKRLSEKYNIPYIVTLRGLTDNPDRLVRSNLNKAKSLIAISSKQLLDGEKVSGNSIKFIPHGVKESFFIHKKELIIDQLRLIIVCRLLKLKNIDLVIRALQKINYDYVFDIYGDGPEKEYLEQMIKNLGLENRIHLCGFINNVDLPAKLQEYNLFIMPSYPESLGRVYFEAMASGLPVIASKNTGIDGIIRHGREGFLIDHQSESEILEILELIGKDPNILRAMGNNAMELAQKFHWNNISKSYYDLYTN